MPGEGDTRVLLTGCCGYIGAWITLELLRAGYRVRGTSNGVAHARALHDGVLAREPDGEALRERLEIVHAELLDGATWRGLADGCRVVVHTACPVLTEPGTPVRQMLDPALIGTEHVIREAARAGGVERYVHMSSIVTLLDHHRPSERGTGREVVGPADWNETSVAGTDPYAHAKVRGERLARRLAGELLPGAAFASVLPGPVIGPPVGGERVGASVDKTLAPLLTGQLRYGAVELYLGIVDVRDVAQAFVRVVGVERERLEVLGEGARFICVGRPVASMLDLANAVRASHPAYGSVLPRRLLPVPRRLLLAGMRVALSGEAWSYTRAMLGRRVEYETALTERELSVRWRPLAESVGDTVRWLRDHGHHPPPVR